MKKNLVIILFSLVLTGCYSQGVIQNESMIKNSSEESVILNFIVKQTPNDRHVLLYRSKASIFINGKKIAKLDKNETTQVILKPGKYKITTKFEVGKRHFSDSFEANKIYYFAVGLAPQKTLFQYADRASLTKLSKEEWENYN